jgi:peptide/nickel transport system ATP-binding protein
MHQVLQALQAVGLGAADLDKFPHEFSGGQRQRIAIARALVTRPALIVADEPVSALDVSVQAQVLNLLQSLAQTHGLSYLLISHDLAVVERLCSQLAVMYRGRFVEQGPTRTVLAAPAHPYTRRLIEAAPRLDGHGHGHGRMAGQRPVHRSAPGPGAAEIEGNPQGQHAPGGCYYASCCTAADSRCRGEQPPWTDLGQGHRVACHHPLVLPFSTP